jgi:hypothetical protein
MANAAPATVYLETSVISYLAARPSRDLLVAAHQEVSHRWWEERRKAYELYVSQLVENEIRKGDPTEIENRAALIDGIASLEITEEAIALAESFVTGRAVPSKAEDDAVHIAIATIRGMDFLLTWNMSHMANATVRRRIDKLCESAGLVPPIICTPEELMEER